MKLTVWYYAPDDVILLHVYGPAYESKTGVWNIYNPKHAIDLGWLVKLGELD